MYWLYVELYQQLIMKNYPVSITGFFRERDINGWEVLSCYLARNILEFHLGCNVITENIVQVLYRHTFQTTTLNLATVSPTTPPRPPNSLNGRHIGKLTFE
jgi:hypothetical protein